MIWLWTLIWVFIDIFRSQDLSGWAKALWFVFVLLIPLIGVVVYLVARGDSMSERATQARQQGAYAQGTAADSPANTADQLAKLADLRDRGAPPRASCGSDTTRARSRCAAHGRSGEDRAGEALPRVVRFWRGADPSPEADEILVRRPRLGAFVRQASDLRAELSRTRGSYSLGASALTTAELRLLPMLSTHLSFPEIAEVMFLSRHTVKAEAMSIYRKLGASSRRQAVGRA